MYLTRDEEKALNGEFGEAVKKAMELLVALGEVLGADRLIEVKSVHISGVSYRNIGDAGLEFLEDLVNLGAKVKVKATVNPAGMDLRRWRDMRISKPFAKKQLMVVRCFSKMGVENTFTCTPYLASNKPLAGDHVAWAESSAVVFANSVLGARTNRESGFSALASALTGKTPFYGLHIDSLREPTLHVKLNFKPTNASEYSLLGYMVGMKADEVISVDAEVVKVPTDYLKAFSAGLATAGRVAMFRSDQRAREKISIDYQDFKRLKEQIWLREEDIDYAFIGCPHTSITELEEVAILLKDRKVKDDVALWIFTSRHTYRKAVRKGIVQVIEKSGAKVFKDTCMVVSPLDEMGIRNVVVNSAKAYHYIKNSFPNIKAYFADLKTLIAAVVESG
ncbi:MAG: hypothetical protein DRJ31_00080 [Candidatus Methanomethylicota archaeon]|uniref:Phosphomevalonate dehydratase large subunit n=1 Tax=Thermoproteota archaeon TaxID=2056631 RepID=A0A497EU02_9CREN|nr:MAG: hypothetical protein DRJ31_00080 [Candidatus Verstraetearchaeota archaeon]RLE53627.1 MAG: hypothetical protein DRJ33_00535 [Candidatus Verstraetearchaeota archaeon]